MYLCYHSPGFESDMQYIIYTYRRQLFRKPWKFILSMLVVCHAPVCLSMINYLEVLYLITSGVVFVFHNKNISLYLPGVRKFSCYKSPEAFQHPLGKSYIYSIYKWSKSLVQLMYELYIVKINVTLMISDVKCEPWYILFNFGKRKWKTEQTS